jgi:hypothetical protein
VLQQYRFIIRPLDQFGWLGGQPRRSLPTSRLIVTDLPNLDNFRFAIRKLWRAGLNRNAEGRYFYECRVYPPRKRRYRHHTLADHRPLIRSTRSG